MKSKGRRSLRWLLVLLIAAGAGGSIYWFTKGTQPRCKNAPWSIGVLQGADLFALHEPDGSVNPVFGAAQVTDMRTDFTADVFAIEKDGRSYLFFEAFDRDTSTGAIAYASSADRLHWEYGRVVLREPFHLSYPFVFEHDGSYYMIPETRKAGGILLYRARAFPEGWEFQKELVHGNFADSTLFQYENRWWLFSVEGSYRLAIHYADDLFGPWRAHARSPFSRDGSKSRPGGRMVLWKGKPVRFAQDSTGGYGHQLRAFVIDTLTPDAYAEHEAEKAPFLSPEGTGWRSEAMHQIDPRQLPDGSWVAFVDGAGCPGS